MLNRSPLGTNREQG